MNEISTKTINEVLGKISKEILINKDKINNNLNLGLNKILEKSQNSEDKYINVLKQQVLYQMVRGRNREALLVKWIGENNILPKINRDMELENLNKKIQLYIKNGLKSGGKLFSKNELNLLSSYQNISGEELKKKLEKDYKQLNIYNDVINKLINNIESLNIDDISKEDKNELIRFINSEVKKATSFIIKSMSVETNSIDEEKKEKVVDFEVEEKENTLETELENIINNISKDDLINKMQNVFNDICEKEEIEQEKAYKFGQSNIKEYILCVNLLDLLKEEEKLLINGAMRLAVTGLIGEFNFNEFTKYIIIEVFKVNENKYDEIIKLIEDKHLDLFGQYLNTDIKIKESMDIDFEEYIYMLRNANPNERYRKEMPEFDGEEEETVEEVVEEKKPKKKGKVIGLAVGILLIVGIGGAIVVKQIGGKDNGGPSNITISDGGGKEGPQEKKSIIDCGVDEYILYDSDLRMLDESELKDYTKEELGYIRNEIFARYGFVFGNNEYKKYFEGKSWYYPDIEFKADEENLNEYEIANIKLIKSLEEGK